MPNVIAYGRVSTQRQASRGESLETQESDMRRVYECEYQHKGYGWAVVRDPAESGGKPLLNRKGGAKLNALLERGDVVIFPKLDRGFRNTRDALNTVEAWTERGVIVRMLDLKLDTGCPLGKLLLTVMAAVAEFERQRIRERQRDGWGHRRRRRREGDQSVVCSPRAPYGFRTIKNTMGKVIWVRNENQRELGAKIVQWHDERRMSFREIYKHVVSKNIYRYDAKGRALPWSRREAAVHDLYRMEKALREREASADSMSKDTTSGST